jgi:hypothetical protein
MNYKPLTDEELVMINRDACHGSLLRGDEPLLMRNGRAVEGAVLARIARPEWQPIETAPHSGAPILTYDRLNRVKVLTGHYMHNMLHSAFIDGDECFYTHWMPLPQPPEPTP